MTHTTTCSQLRRGLLLLLLTLCSLTIDAQTTLVKAQLKDATTQESEPYVTVRVYTSDNREKPVAMSVADGDGLVSQEVKGQGSFVLQLSTIGKKVVEKPFTLKGERELNLGTILMEEDAQVVAGVEVVGTKPLVKMEADKMTYSVENDQDSRTQTVLDMLRKVPMVTVDGQDNITVNGSSNFQVYVNGKPNPMLSQYASIAFKQMPASMVKSIEVVTNPGARYDAEGTGGVLNIVMQTQDGQTQKMNGMSGQANLMAAREGVGGGVSLTGQQGKWSYSAQLFGNHMEMNRTTVDINRHSILNNQLTSDMTYHQSGRHIQNFVMASLGAGVELDSMSNLNASFSLMNSRNKDRGFPTTDMVYNYSGADMSLAPMSYSYSNRMKQVQKWNNLQASIDYQRFFNKDHTHWLSLIYQLGYQPTGTDNWTLFDEAYQLPLDLTSRKSLDDNRTTEHTLQADYVVPVSKTQTLSAGLKYSTRLSKAISDYYLDQDGEMTFSPDMSMHYRFTNHVAAAYLEDDIKLGKWGLKPGVRYEHTWQHVEYRLGQGENFSKRYGNFVPSMTISYALAPVVNLGLTYNMRISRPGIGYLNPYINRSNPTSISYGNTHLKVEKSHTLRLSFNAFLGKLMLTANLQQRISNNGISQYSFLEGEILHNTYGNNVKTRQSAFNMFASWSPWQSTRFIVNEEVSYTDLESTVSGRRNHGWKLSSMVGLQQKLPAKFNFNLYLINRTKTFILPGWTSGFNMVNATINRSFFNDKLTVGLSGISGLGHGGKFCFDTYTSGPNYRQLQRVRVPVQTVMLQLTYSFGKLKTQQQKQTKEVDNNYKDLQNQQIDLNGMGGMGGGN